MKQTSIMGMLPVRTSHYDGVHGETIPSKPKFYDTNNFPLHLEVGNQASLVRAPLETLVVTSHEDTETQYG